MIEDIVVPLVATAIAELGDKTQLSVLLLSSRTEKRTHLLLGVLFAFLIVDGVAVLVGSHIAEVVPSNLLIRVSGVIFIIFGVLTLLSKETEKEAKSRFEKAFVSGFAVVAVAELGDKTQIASALFAAHYDALLVLVGIMTALTVLSVIAVYLGKLISSRVDRKKLKKVAGIVFIVMGIAFLVL